VSDVQQLLARCRQLGATLTPKPDGKLNVKAPAPLPEALQMELKRRKPELLRLLALTALFPCPSCGGVVTLEKPDPSILPTRMWACHQCSTWGVSRDGARLPTSWVCGGTIQ
jgi:hypothetical protein